MPWYTKREVPTSSAAGLVFISNSSGEGTWGAAATAFTQVPTYADLPSAAAHSGEIYYVQTGTGVWLINRKSPGFYRSDGATWNYAGELVEAFASNNFEIYDASDNSKALDFNVASIGASTTRTITMPNQNINLTPTSGTFAASSINIDTVLANGNTTDEELVFTGPAVIEVQYFGGVAGIRQHSVSGEMEFFDSSGGQMYFTASSMNFSNAVVIDGNPSTLYFGLVTGTAAAQFSGFNDELYLTGVGTTTQFRSDLDFLLTTSKKVQFRDTGLFINSSVDGQLDIDADVEIEITTPNVDLNGFLDVSGGINSGSQISVLGSADVTQLLIRGNATQTNFLAIFENSTGVDQITFSGTGAAVFNEGGNAVNFRVESDTNQNMLIVDGTNNSVGVGSSTNLGSALHVNSGIDQVQLAIRPRTGATEGHIELQDSSGNALFTHGPTGAVVFNEQGNSVDFRIESNLSANCFFVSGSGDGVVIGGNTKLGFFAVDGRADEIQLCVQGNGTQTALLAVFENSAGTDQITFGGTGAAVFNEAGNAVNFRVESDTDANCLVVDGTNNRVGIGTASPSEKLNVVGNIEISTAGNGINLPEGSNARMGTATLVAGTVTVNTTAVTANSRIFLTSNVDGGTPGTGVRVSARTAATSFTITSANALDTSDVAWVIFEPS